MTDSSSPTMTLVPSTPRVALRYVAMVILSLAVACSLDTAPTPGSNPATETYAASLGVNLAQMMKVSSALYTQDLIVGTGVVLANGDSISVTYTGWLVTGTQFDTHTGFQTRIGVAHVIDGWDLGLVGMKVGGKRRLVMGSDLGYGAGGVCTTGGCPIPPNSTLVFDVQLLAKLP